MNGNTGRPELTNLQKQLMVQKLEPYLKAGLSLRKSCFMAQIPRSTVYCLMDKDGGFLDQIRRFQQFVSVMVSGMMFKQLIIIANKQRREAELTKSDIKFLQWFALHSNQTQEEFGRRMNINDAYDPEVEIHRIAQFIDSSEAN